MRASSSDPVARDDDCASSSAVWRGPADKATQRWTMMTDTERAPWTLAAKKDKERAEAENEEFRSHFNDHRGLAD